MEQVLEAVKQLSINDLRQQLSDNGVNVGPILPSTKLIFQKKLASKLYEKQHPISDAVDGNTGDNQVFQTSGDTQICEQNAETGQVKEETPATEPEVSVYYGVCPPLGVSLEEKQGQTLVFTDKKLALQSVKKFSGARFKCFKSKEDAEKFSKLSPDDIASPWKPTTKNGNGAIATLSTGVSVESSPFKGPKPQELSKLRKAIEEGDVVTVESLVWENPRFLVSGGDTPVILQEGPRYNALHIAARSNQAGICQLILDTLEDPSFIDKLYGHTNETEGTRTNRINFIVDLYLNTPDKAACEVPLHFACKHGFAEVVAVLISHPKIDKSVRNKFNETPREIICSRVDNATTAQREEIKELMEGQFFVPLLRSEDNSSQPFIGIPWSPESSRSTVNLPPLSWSPKDPLMAVKACAGPMTPSKANLFHKRWNTPPSNSPDYAKRKFYSTKREDSEKGLERIGRQLAHDMGIPWVEYWDFLQTYTDMTTDDGLDLLEEYLQKQSLALCIEEALGKLDLLSNSFHSFKYNQMDMSISQSKDGGGSMNVSWLMSPLADIEESLHEQEMVDIDKYLHGNIMDQVKNYSSNGALPNSETMKRSVRIDESFTMPKKNIYDYGRMNRSMEWSMDSSDWSQESFSGILTPMSCLSALFSKLSLLDRSRRQRRLSGSQGCLGISCLGSGYPGFVKSTRSEHGKIETSGLQSNGAVPHDTDNVKEMQSSGCVYIREARLTADNNNQEDLKNSNTEEYRKTADGFQSTELFVVDDNLNKTTIISAKEPDESTVLVDNVQSCETNIRGETNWREKSQTSSSSSQGEEHQAIEELLQRASAITESQRQPTDQIDDLVNQFNEKIDFRTSVNSESALSNQSERETPMPRKRLTFSEDKVEEQMESSTEEDLESCHLDITLQLDKDRVPSFEFQSMFELLNEKKTLQNQKDGNTRRVIYSRDIILDLAGQNLEDVDSVSLSVAVVPPNSTVAEMAIFSNIPFFVIRGSQYKPGDSFPSKLPAMVDVVFNFVKDSVTSALAVNNKSRGKIYFISGYQPSKTDLDVYRAIQGREVEKENYPLIHRWRALVSSRMANPNCSWPSPARSHFQGNLSASFPQVSTPNKAPESPIVFYRSPIPRGTPTRQKMSATWSMPNIKAQLFPRSPMAERR
ncbi:ankyrin repeat and LEM domain-containing protein 2-like [Saccostrea echinata]|uniref:ankyrin repeat and LEM domain-containing protein 2-like n=1 Tax=Saccostrea echinata TaxID=191078 RepID=UPI002A7FAD11|nr:ankyrin repeat and LEM domain-containing protein 2-like [Saccostrea echinata]